MPDDTDLLTRVKAYIGSTNRAESEIEAALVAEQGHQARTCRFPAEDDTSAKAEAWRAVLEEALCRRVAVNLARRALPLGMQTTDVGTARLGSKDPEVRRLEGPYRKVTFG